MRAILMTLAACAWLAAQGREVRDALARVSEEAETFQRLAQNVVGRETLEHKGRKAPPRIQWRGAGEQPEVKYNHRKIVSEYAFGRFKEAPEWIREFRTVVEVDGRAVLSGAQGAVRQKLAENMASEDDRLRRRLLEDFAKRGQTGAATDFGQMLLLFRRRELGNFEFQLSRKAYLGAEECLVIRWRQMGNTGDEARVYEGGKLHKIPMEGELWVRSKDYQPVRITMQLAVEEDKLPVLHSAEIDYQQFRMGLMLPVAVVYRKKVKDMLMVENRATYGNYQMFRSDAEIKFSAVEEPEGQPGPQLAAPAQEAPGAPAKP
jgi:hypothetical protein